MDLTTEFFHYSPPPPLPLSLLSFILLYAAAEVTVLTPRAEKDYSSRRVRLPRELPMLPKLSLIDLTAVICFVGI